MLSNFKAVLLVTNYIDPLKNFQKSNLYIRDNIKIFHLKIKSIT